MSNSEINRHAEIIRDNVFHTFPFNRMIPNFKGPHAEDCGGCIIEAEVDKLVTKLNALSHVEDIIAELEQVKHGRKLLSDERHLAFEKAGVNADGKSITDLVESLVKERDHLHNLIEYIRNNMNNILIKVNEISEK